VQPGWHDFDMQAALAAVSVARIQHVRVTGIRFHVEVHVAVVRVLHGCLADRAPEGGAGAEHLQPIGTLHTVPWVPLAGAAPNGVRSCCNDRTGWHANPPATATGERRGKAEDKDEAE
jgi:hypothetical protein